MKNANNEIAFSKSKNFFGLFLVLCSCLVICTIGLILSTPSISFASEEKTGIQVVLPNMIEFIPMIIAFIVMAIILYKFGWPKFEQMLDNRKNTIEGAIKDSEEKREESERILNEYKQKLADAEDQADEIIKNAKISGREIGAKIESDAKQNAEATTQKARLAIDQSKKAAQQEIKSEAVDVALTAVAKFVSNDLTDDEHRKIIEKYVLEAGNIAG